jgi:hypothetical protein
MEKEVGPISREVSDGAHRYLRLERQYVLSICILFILYIKRTQSNFNFRQNYQL